MSRESLIDYNKYDLAKFLAVKLIKHSARISEETDERILERFSIIRKEDPFKHNAFDPDIPESYFGFILLTFEFAFSQARNLAQSDDEASKKITQSLQKIKAPIDKYLSDNNITTSSSWLEPPLPDPDEILGDRIIDSTEPQASP